MRGALEGAVEGIGDRENGGDQLRPGDLHLVKLPVPRGVEVGHGALAVVPVRVIQLSESSVVLVMTA